MDPSYVCFPGSCAGGVYDRGAVGWGPSLASTLATGLSRMIELKGIWKVCACIHMCVCAGVYVSTCMCAHKCLHARAHVRCVRVCMHMCMYVYMHTCVHTCLHSWAYAHTGVCECTCFARADVCMHACTHVHTWVLRGYTRVFVHLCMCVHVVLCTHTYVCACVCTRVCTCVTVSVYTILMCTHIDVYVRMWALICVRVCTRCVRVEFYPPSLLHGGG